MWAEVVLGLIFLWLLFQLCKKPEGLPPGLWGLPLLGSIGYITFPMEADIKKMNKKYGDIFLIRIGTSVNVFICNYEISKEVFSRSEFTGRPPMAIFSFMGDGENLGLTGSHGLVWQKGRRFTIRHLRQLGLGKSYLSGAIQSEALELVKGFEADAGGLTDLGVFINIAVVNVIWKLAANQRFDTNDERSMRFLKLVKDWQEEFGFLTIQDYFPWLTKILPVWAQNKYFHSEVMLRVRDQIGNHIQGIIDEHKTSLNPSSPLDLIDDYLIKIEATKDDPDSIFNEKNLKTTIWDLFDAGNDTVSTTIRWILLYMARYPEVQKRVQKEIDDVVPREVQPSWEDKDRMPYTEATITEVHRIVSLTYLGLPHCASKDTVICDYKIPKGTAVYPVCYHCHSDEKYWDKPSEFRPERFLDENNMFVAPRDGFLPFGIGRRQCPGESLAKMELFIFTTTLLQKFTFSPGPEGVNLEPMDVPIVNYPRPHKMKIDVRKDSDT